MATARQVSVVIAAYRSDAVIEACLLALRRQTFSDFETIVVNSSPGDRTRHVVTTAFPEVTFIEHPSRLLPHAARNRGVAAASGRLLAFTDADCRPAPDWLDQLVAAERAGHAVVCGSIEPDDPSPGWLAIGVHLCKYSFRLSTLPAGPSAIAGTANACYARAVWESVGPFDGEQFAGDALLSWKAARAGWPAWFAPQAIVRHAFDHTLTELWRERRERGDDFARARAAAEHWSGWRLTAQIVGLPLLPMLPLARGWRDAVQAGWTLRFVWTLPVQVIGHLSWSLGEARAAFARLRART